MATSTDTSTGSQAFTINITDVNEAAAGSAVGITALATDTDGTDTVIYSLSDDIVDLKVTTVETDQSGESEAIPMGKSYGLADNFDVSSLKDNLIFSADQPVEHHLGYNHLPSRFEDFANTSKQMSTENQLGTFFDLVKASANKVFEFITPSASAAPVPSAPSYSGIYEAEHKEIQQHIDVMHQEIDQAFDESADQYKIEVYMSGAISLSVGVGAMSYLLQGGSLMSSFLATVPLWKGFDPIPILFLTENKQKDKEKTLEKNAQQSIEETNQKAENMFNEREER